MGYKRMKPLEPSRFKKMLCDTTIPTTTNLLIFVGKEKEYEKNEFGKRKGEGLSKHFEELILHHRDVSLMLVMLVMTVGRGQLTVVEWHELLIPHHTTVHSAVMVAVDGRGWGAFVA